MSLLIGVLIVWSGLTIAAISNDTPLTPRPSARDHTTSLFLHGLIAASPPRMWVIQYDAKLSIRTHLD